MQMVRTTVYLEEGLVRQAKLEAVKRKSSLTKLVERGLKRELERAGRPKKVKFRMGTHNLGGYRFRRADAYE